MFQANKLTGKDFHQKILMFHPQKLQISSLQTSGTAFAQEMICGPSLRFVYSVRIACSDFFLGGVHCNIVRPPTLNICKWCPQTSPDSRRRLNLKNSRRGHWKRGICIKLSEMDFPIRDKFTTILRTLPLMYETKYPAILRKFGAQFATNLRNAPLANAPFSGFLIQCFVAVTIRLRLPCVLR